MATEWRRWNGAIETTTEKSANIGRLCSESSNAVRLVHSNQSVKGEKKVENIVNTSNQLQWRRQWLICVGILAKLLELQGRNKKCGRRKGGWWHLLPTVGLSYSVIRHFASNTLTVLWTFPTVYRFLFPYTVAEPQITVDSFTSIFFRIKLTNLSCEIFQALRECKCK